MSIFISASGTDEERFQYTSFFSPNPTAAEGGAGETPPDVNFWSGGSGDISGELDTYTNRDGITPSGGSGAL